MQLLSVLSDPNTQVVLLGTALLGICAGVVGTFATLRGRALLGDALAHAALPGICLAYMVTAQKSFWVLLLGALLSSLAAAFLLSVIRRFTKLKDDAALALILSTFFGAGIALSRVIQNQPGGNRAGLDGFILGKAASLVWSDVFCIATVTVVALLVVSLIFKELKTFSFDPGFSSVTGFSTGLLDAILMILITTCTVAGLPAVGAILIAALLIIPPSAARCWSDRLSVVIVLSGIFGAFACSTGTVLSAIIPGPSGNLNSGLPTGPLIVLVIFVVFLISVSLSPRRGFLAEFLRRVRVRKLTAKGASISVG